MYLESLWNLVDWVVALVVGASRTQEPCKPSKSTTCSLGREREQAATVNLITFNTDWGVLMQPTRSVGKAAKQGSRGIQTRLNACGKLG